MDLRKKLQLQAATIMLLLHGLLQSGKESAKRMALMMQTWRMNTAYMFDFLPNMSKFAKSEVGQIGIGDIPNFVVLLGLAGVSGSVMLLILVELQVTNDSSATVNSAIDKVISGIDKIFDFFDILGLSVIAAIIISVIFSAFAFGQFTQRQGRQGF